MVRMKNSNKVVTVTLVFVSFVIFLSLYLAFRISDPHMVNRVGATCSALGALLVIAQVFIENLHERKGDKELRVVEAKNLAPFERERIEKIISNREKSRVRERYQIVSCIALVVFIGEILHGWGDLIYKLIY